MSSTRLQISNALQTEDDYHRLIEENRQLLVAGENRLALYSGREVASADLSLHNGHLAEEATKSGKYVRIEATPLGRFLEMQDLLGEQSPVTEESALRVWAHASKVLCEQAKGNVLAFVLGADPNKTFRQVELPALLNNDLVHSINYASIEGYRKEYRHEQSSGKQVLLDRLFTDVQARLNETSLEKTFRTFQELSPDPSQSSTGITRRFAVNAEEYAHQIGTRLIPQLEYLQQKVDVQRVENNFDPYSHKYKPALDQKEALEKARSTVLGPKWEESRRRLLAAEKRFDEIRQKIERFNEVNGEPSASASNFRQAQYLNKELRIANKHREQALSILNTLTTAQNTPETRNRIKMVTQELLEDSKASQELQRKLDMQHSQVRSALQEAYQLKRTLSDIGDRTVVLEHKTGVLTPKLLGTSHDAKLTHTLGRRLTIER